jgi:exopolysaccharide biosynthesis polyprenyl glycosylphosphotransferase
MIRRFSRPAPGAPATAVPPRQTEQELAGPAGQELRQPADQQLPQPAGQAEPAAPRTADGAADRAADRPPETASARVTDLASRRADSAVPRAERPADGGVRAGSAGLTAPGRGGRVRTSRTEPIGARRTARDAALPAVHAADRPAAVPGEAGAGPEANRGAVHAGPHAHPHTGPDAAPPAVPHTAAQGLLPQPVPHTPAQGLPHPVPHTPARTARPAARTTVHPALPAVPATTGRLPALVPAGTAAPVPGPGGAPGTTATGPDVPGRPGGTGPGQRPAGTGRPRHRAFRPRGGSALVAADCAGVLAGLAVEGPQTGPVAAVLLVGVLVTGQWRRGLYRPGFAPAAFAEAPALAVRAALAWGAAATAAAANEPDDALGWGALLAGLAVTVLTACTLRALVHGRRRHAARGRPRSTLIVGSDPAVRQIATALREHPEYGMRPVGVVLPGPAADPNDPAVPRCQAPGPPKEMPLPVLTGHTEITRAVVGHGVRHAVVAGPGSLDAATTAAVRLLAAQGCCVWQLGTGTGPGPVPAAHLWGFAVRRLATDPSPVPRPGRRAKRALDAVAAAAALLALAPVLGACALAVRLADGPGVLFRQERIGLGGRPFTLLKFRTLRPGDARESATRWSVAGDRRVSPVGRLLRRTSLDELPQLWNVLRGDMSLVGPRPERPYFVEQFSRTYPGYEDRHRMPAGITGLAQVHGLRGDTSIADRARFDNHYIDSWSWWQDVAILLRTLRSVFRFGGS